MTQTHSLTAYRCTFSYMERNNPVDTDEMKESIKNGEKPSYSLLDFLNDYIKFASSFSNSKSEENADKIDKVIRITKIASTTSLPNDVKRIHIKPQAGKYGEPVTVVEGATNKSHNFGKNDPALYNYNVFFYEKGKEIVALFYRKGTSGCKTVFFETANKELRKRGMKLEMELIVPLDQHIIAQNATASTVTLKWTAPAKKSTDVAENTEYNDGKEKPKTRVIQNLVINLKADESGGIKKIVDNLMLGNISNDVAFARISAEYLGDSNRNNFNDAIIDFKIGNKIVSRFRFGEIENQIGAYNITNSLSVSDFENSLILCADAYYNKIAEGMA